ncbi:hypothetical protein NL676_015505 [Syzygium grande]|nr:hypothetical protein NL676_015505 [Syzygium grande]
MLANRGSPGVATSAQLETSNGLSGHGSIRFSSNRSAIDLGVTEEVAGFASTSNSSPKKTASSDRIRRLFGLPRKVMALLFFPNVTFQVASDEDGEKQEEGVGRA